MKAGRDDEDAERRGGGLVDIGVDEGLARRVFGDAFDERTVALERAFANQPMTSPDPPRIVAFTRPRPEIADEDGEGAGPLDRLIHLHFGSSLIPLPLFCLLRFRILFPFRLAPRPPTTRLLRFRRRLHPPRGSCRDQSPLGADSHRATASPRPIEARASVEGC